MNDIFNERMMQLKKESGLSYKKIEALTGIPYTTLYSYTKREVDARAYSLIALAKAFGVSVDWLLGLTEERTINEGRILPEEDDRTGRSEDQS